MEVQGGPAELALLSSQAASSFPELGREPRSICPALRLMRVVIFTPGALPRFSRSPRGTQGPRGTVRWGTWASYLQIPF